MTSAAPGSEDTIAAEATPSGRGAISLVRVSGPDAFTVCRSIVDRFPDAPRHAVLTAVRDRGGALLDRAIVVRFDAPASFTGEDVVELSTHGGAVVPATVLAALFAGGARQALPGEFTRRAVLNGKLDLVQAEAIGDLVASTSRAAQRVALEQLDGGLSRRILSLRDAVVSLEALVAYDIDFPEEDDGPIPAARVRELADHLTTQLAGLLDTAPVGELVREGAVVVLAGPPNVGKSSLFNALLGRARAIVTDVPGTTRDAIEAVVDEGTVPLRLVDTAGLRDSADVVERLGIEISERYLGEAHVVLACGDDALSLAHARDVVRRHTSAPVLAVRTKGDRPSPDDGRLDGALIVSAESGQGIAELRKAIAAVVARELGGVALDAPMITRERQRAGLERALAEAEAFTAAWHEGVPATLAAVHLRTAALALEDLIGRVDVEDVLDELFRRFCVGK